MTVKFQIFFDRYFIRKKLKNNSFKMRINSSKEPNTDASSYLFIQLLLEGMLSTCDYFVDRVFSHDLYGRYLDYYYFYVISLEFFVFVCLIWLCRLFIYRL